MDLTATASKTLSYFEEKYATTPLLTRSPGRVNIIGEHTDYNEGYVLPAAIDKAVYVAIAKRDDTLVEMHSLEFSEMKTADIRDLKPEPGSWTNYILGVVVQFQKRGFHPTGFNLVIDGDVPFGAGLSSSAAVECATAMALNNLFGFGVPRGELIFIAQKAEHEFAGVLCGIMDQFASMFGKKDHVIRLDCRSMDYQYIPLKLEGYKILLLNTNVKHSLASSEYNVRRAQCEEGVLLVQQHAPGVNSLRDVTMQQLEDWVAPVNEMVYRRCRYVVEENMRLLAACEDLEKGHIASMGEKMFDTHDGLSKLYEVSCAELDFLVDAVRDEPAVLGARMMGGGFGGCTINIVQEDAIEGLVKNLSVAYKKAMNLELTSYIAAIEDGTTELER